MNIDVLESRRVTSVDCDLCSETSLPLALARWKTTYRDFKSDRLAPQSDSTHEHRTRPEFQR
ncbi:hypothetical protein RB5061 [Rhodopirellula baltica SH 1]|uniref:Uncharacterized protein n=1 Tax=Rhodopirellula baltica (strain DSM 10527 / NCIMB 13988 / SH1) TaxID=243090 RepID=Q7UGR6_RHOBA|nr:hypothetical protein RB5061 [Rhodopirellula baltica SH 1]